MEQTKDTPGTHLLSPAVATVEGKSASIAERVAAQKAQKAEEEARRAAKTTAMQDAMRAAAGLKPAEGQDTPNDLRKDKPKEFATDVDATPPFPKAPAEPPPTKPEKKDEKQVLFTHSRRNFSFYMPNGKQVMFRNFWHLTDDQDEIIYIRSQAKHFKLTEE